MKNIYIGAVDKTDYFSGYGNEMTEKGLDSFFKGEVVMFVLRFTVQLPLYGHSEKLYKTENREITVFTHQELLDAYKKLKEYEGVFFSNIKVYAVTEKEIDTRKLNELLLKGGRISGV